MARYICFPRNRSLLALREPEACFPRSRLESGTIFHISQWVKLPPGASGSSTINTRHLASFSTPSIFNVGLTSLPSQVKRSGMFPPSLKSGLLSFIACSCGIFALPVLVIRLRATIATPRRVFIESLDPTIARFSEAIRQTSLFKGSLRAKFFAVGWAVGAPFPPTRAVPPHWQEPPLNPMLLADLEAFADYTHRSICLPDFPAVSHVRRYPFGPDRGERQIESRSTGAD